MMLNFNEADHGAGMALVLMLICAAFWLVPVIGMISYRKAMIQEKKQVVALQLDLAECWAKCEEPGHDCKDACNPQPPEFK